MTETSIKNNKAPENLNDKFLENMKERGILASYLMCALSEVTNPENTTQYNLVNVYNSIRVKNLLIHNTIPITPITIA